VIFTIQTPLSLHASQILYYEPTFKPFYNDKGVLQIAIRQYDKESIHYFLALDPTTFKIREIMASQAIFSDSVENETWQNTPFFKALFQYIGPSCPLQNGGLIKSEYPISYGMFLTIDLCPSQKPLDKNLFKMLMGLSYGDVTEPIPVAISITGRWVEEHETDFKWLQSQIRSNRLQVTWINHSYSHPYCAQCPLDQNFLLMPDVDFKKEVLSTEIMLLEHGLMPSPFFRFPGLVSNQSMMETLAELCLIPVGTNAWLSKGEIPENGSIILVHGNGNDEKGVQILKNLLDEQKDKHFLLPLIDAVTPAYF
jgi:hypothetical protein